MPRPTTKDSLLREAAQQFAALEALVDSMPRTIRETSFDFSDQPSRTQQHWARDQNLRDVLVHLHEWHNLLLGWVEANRGGNPQPFLPHPYNWRTYGRMNQHLWQQHQTTDLAEAQMLLQQTHQRVMELITSFSGEELFTKSYFAWTGSTTLGSYCASATSSHYSWALQKLRAHLRTSRST